MNILLYPIFIPIIVGLICLFLKRRNKEITLLTAVVVFLISIFIFTAGDMYFSQNLYEPGIDFSLKSYGLSSFILMAISFFTMLIIAYSFKYMESKERLNEYYGYILITLGAAAGAVLSSNLILFTVFWGISGLTLYLLIGLGGFGASQAAKKTFIIVGGSDALMILGIGIIWFLVKTFDMDSIKLTLDGVLPALAFLTLVAAAIAKAGAIPLHTWIPDSAEVAPTPIMAYLPASLDKLLGIYLLARISLDLFIIHSNSLMSIVLMIIGSITIVAAVMGALVQHNLKKLLSFHAVSQVGYMVLGIGTGIPVGIAGGLFHMLNNTIYKSALFLVGGSVEKKTGTAELNRLGGLARVMPITFVCGAVFALSISGIPPFNGFVSKWMIYQALVELGKTGGGWWIIWLVSAMFGSALTLASFMKLMHATFLGEMNTELKSRNIKDVSSWMWGPMVILAALCAIFGIFAYAFPLKFFILPSVPFVFFTGIWSPALAVILIVVGLMIGGIIYSASNLKRGKRDAIFVGGEIIEEEKMKVSGVRFYDTVKDLPVIKELYEESEARFYDIYEVLSKGIFFCVRWLRWLHNGLLHTYLAWCLIGLVLLFIILVR